MELDSTLQKGFLEQLQALERFRISYSGAHPSLPLDRADQDIQRLLEAQAFFTARTARVSEANLTRGTRRLFTQHLPYLLSPSPAMGLLQARTDAQFVDPAYIPAGEQLGLVPEGEKSLEDTPPPLALVTLAPLRLLPLELSSVRYERRRAGEPAQLLLSFEARHVRLWAPGTIALFVNHLSDFDASAAVFVALEASMERAELSWDGKPPIRCPVRFGPISADRPSRQGLCHPLEQVRGFFRVPEQDLFLSLEVPAPTSEWTRFDVRLVLSERWPQGLEPTRDVLSMHVVPVANIQRELASPLHVDGTRVEYAVTHPDPLAGFVPHSVLAAYRADAQRGMVPLKPGFVPGSQSQLGSPHWEADVVGLAQERTAKLRVAAPEALTEPFRVSVEARWHQPARSAGVREGDEIEMLNRSLEGVSLKLKAKLRAASDGLLDSNDDALLELLASRSRRVLGLSELGTLMNVLRGPGERGFEDVSEALQDLEVHTVPSAISASGFRYRYRITLGFEDPRNLPRWRIYFYRLREVLEVWSTEDVVELEVQIPRLDITLRFDGKERIR